MAIRVAVIDDHPVYRQGLRAVLASDAFADVVGEAGDAAEAYDLVQASSPDLVVVDLSLPGTNGIAVVRELVKRDPKRRLLMLSMRVEEDLIADALAAGALGYAGKDQPIDELVQAVRLVADGQTYLPPNVNAEAIGERVRRGRGGRGGPLGVLSGREREVFDMLV